MKLFVQSLRDPSIRFEVLSFDPATKRGRIKSLRYGSEFDEPLDKETLTQLGYCIERVEEETDHA